MRRDKFKEGAKTVLVTTLKFTILLPFYIYYNLSDKYGVDLNKAYYRYIIKNKSKYKEKVLSEIIKYITNRSMPRVISRYKGRDFIYNIFLERHSDCSADLHLKDFISYSSHGFRKRTNKISKAYYNACRSEKRDVEYNWFMDELEKYFINADFNVKRDIHKSWYEETEFIELTLK